MRMIRNSLLDIFFPRLCICCDKRLITQETHLCIDCLARLPKTYYETEENNKLEELFAGRFSFQHAASFLYFIKEGSTQKIIHEFKYRNNPKLGVFMAKLCCQSFPENSFIHDIDLIIPVPLHKKRLGKRGYNQSCILAETIGSYYRIPVNSTNLIRITDNTSQTNKSRMERWENTEGIFNIVDRSIFAGKHILLVDDVITTGFTLEACAKLINQCKDSRLSIYALTSAI